MTRASTSRGFDAAGQAVFRQVGIEEIDFRGRFGARAYSTTRWTIQPNVEAVFVLDDAGEKFEEYDDVQATAVGIKDCYGYGVITKKDTLYGPARLVLAMTDVSVERGTFQFWELQVVARRLGGYFVSTEIVDASLGAAAWGTYPLGGGPNFTKSTFVTRS